MKNLHFINPITELVHLFQRWHLNHENTKLYNAIISTGRPLRSLESAREAIRDGADVNAAHVVNNVSYFPLLLAVQRKRFDILALLIANKANVNIKDANGNTAMSLAYDDENTRFMTELHAAGANINEVFAEGNTLLHKALSKGKDVLAEFLIGLKANLKIRNTAGQTPLYISYLANDSDMMQKLHAAGADINEKFSNGESLLLKAISEAKDTLALFMMNTLKADMTIINDAKETGLHIAVRQARYAVIDTMMGSGARDITNASGMTPYRLFKSLTYLLPPYNGLPKEVKEMDCIQTVRVFEKYALQQVEAVVTATATNVGNTVTAVENTVTAVETAVSNAVQAVTGTITGTLNPSGSQVTVPPKPETQHAFYLPPSTTTANNAGSSSGSSSSYFSWAYHQQQHLLQIQHQLQLQQQQQLQQLQQPQREYSSYLPMNTLGLVNRQMPLSLSAISIGQSATNDMPSEEDDDNKFSFFKNVR